MIIALTVMPCFIYRPVKSAVLIFMFSALLPPCDVQSANPMPPVPTAHTEAEKQARKAFENGNYRESEKIYERILATAPNNLHALSNLGVVRFRMGKFRLSEQTFLQAISLEPRDAFCHRMLGFVYYYQDRFDDAIKSLKRAIEIDPENASAHNYLGISYCQKGMQREAEIELEKAQKLEPTRARPERLPKEIPAKFRIHEA
jgi:Flp pilus assembly protein TadD